MLVLDMLFVVSAVLFDMLKARQLACVSKNGQKCPAALSSLSSWRAWIEILRRTFCTLSRDAGVPDRDIMAAGGWNSPQMLDYYDMSRRGLNGKAGDGLQDYLGKEDDETGFQQLANTR